MKKGITDKKILFFIFNALLNNDKVNKEDLLSCFEINESTFYKHLNSIKEAGFEVKRKDKDIYELIKYSGVLNLAKYEISVLIYLLLISDAMLPSKKTKCFMEVVNKVLSLTTKENACAVMEGYKINNKQSILSTYSEKIEILSKYLNLNKKIKVVLIDLREIVLIPLELYWIKEKLFLKYVDEEENISDICLDKIIKIVENKKSIKIQQSEEIVFELYGRLAQSYLLKEDERIIQYSKDKIVVASQARDKKTLFRRLLRYDVLCKVTHSKINVNEFREIIKKSLDNIL